MALSFDLNYTFRCTSAVPELPELQKLGHVVIDNTYSRAGDEAKAEVRSYEWQVSHARVIAALAERGIRVNRYCLKPMFPDEFWDRLPSDCVGGLLGCDGFVSVGDHTLRDRIVPLDQPLYISGRPESDSDQSRERPLTIGNPGGIPILSDRFIAELQKMGIQGETAPIIYRGHNKKSYDRVQPGYKRFLISPQFEMPDDGDFDFLPAAALTGFDCAAMLRTMAGYLIAIRGDARSYDIAFSVERCQELRCDFPGILLSPIFRPNGQTHEYKANLQAAVDRLNAGAFEAEK